MIYAGWGDAGDSWLSDVRRVGGRWGLLADMLDALIHLVDDMDDS